MLGQTIGHYRIEVELGRGGMGVVYRAQDERLRRPVALKLLTKEIAGQAERRARLLAEARAAAPLNHPGIATIYEVGEEEGQLFIVMELLAGTTLREVVRQGSAEPRALARLGAQVAEALSAAHVQGIVHGDVKPENIMVLADGRTKLLDFGIARPLADETATVTRTGGTHSWLGEAQLAGTLAYMAPEQVRGEPCDARADLFALGVVLYEMAAGHRPFPGPTPSAFVSQILNDPPAPLKGGKRPVPAELARIVHKLLEKDREARYQSAREVQVDLNNLVRDLELGALLPAAVAGKRAVAVLPFKLLTPNPEDDYLSIALADAVITHLSTSGKLLVRSTSSVQRYARQAVDPLMAARELNVEIIVDGSIQKSGQQVRVHVQAWNAADGSSVLSAKHDATRTDLFGLQDGVSNSLGQALGLKAATPTRAERPTRNPMAYELYLRGVERFSRLNRWDLRTAIEMLEHATQLDPRFADAWARLAEACVQMAIHFDPRPRWIHQAERATRRALALDRSNAEAHCARGKILWTPAKRFQHRAALRKLASAVRLNPGCHEALRYLCAISYHVGLHEEAKEGLTAALATNPDDALTLLSRGHVSFYARDYDEAEEYYARVLTLDPANLLASLFTPLVSLYRQDLQETEKKLRAAMHVAQGEPLLASSEALLWARRGEARKARQAIRRALRGGKSLAHTHHTLHNVAAAYAVLGQPAQAIALLRKAARTGLPNYPLFRDDPHFTSLRNHPQFVRFLVGLKRQWQSYKREFGKQG